MSRINYGGNGVVVSSETVDLWTWVQIPVTALSMKNVLISEKKFGLSLNQSKPINILYSSEELDLDLSPLKYSTFDIKKQIKFPDRVTPELAEEVGISLGDGFLSDNKYEFRVKGSKKERDYYDDLDDTMKEFTDSMGGFDKKDRPLVGEMGA